MKEFIGGETVKVKNSQGLIEDGWRVFLVKADTQEVIVVKEQGSGPISLTIPLAELAALNP